VGVDWMKEMDEYHSMNLGFFFLQQPPTSLAIKDSKRSWSPPLPPPVPSLHSLKSLFMLAMRSFISRNIWVDSQTCQIGLDFIPKMQKWWNKIDSFFFHPNKNHSPSSIIMLIKPDPFNPNQDRLESGWSFNQDLNFFCVYKLQIFICLWHGG